MDSNPSSSTYVPISNLYNPFVYAGAPSFFTSAASNSYYCRVCGRVSTITSDHCCYCKRCCSLLRTPSDAVETPLSPKLFPGSFSLPPSSAPMDIPPPKSPNIPIVPNNTPASPPPPQPKLTPSFIERPEKTSPFNPNFTSFATTLPYHRPKGGQQQQGAFRPAVLSPASASRYHRTNVNYFVLAGDE